MFTYILKNAEIKSNQIKSNQIKSSVTYKDLVFNYLALSEGKQITFWFVFTPQMLYQQTQFYFYFYWSGGHITSPAPSMEVAAMNTMMNSILN